MIISVEYARWLLDEALRHVEVPERTGAVIEGSIAAGFGNESSDIDLLVLDDSDHEHPTMPTILFIDGRRVEVRLKSARQVADQVRDVLRRSRSGPRQLARITEDELNRCERLIGAVVLRDPVLVERIRSVLPVPELRSIVTEWFRVRARQSVRHAIALLALGVTDEAQQWARTALIQGAKTWVAAAGETYLERKWIAQQLARLDDPDGRHERFWQLASATGHGLAAGPYVTACAELVGRFGVDGCPADAGRVVVAARPGVSTWPIGGRPHVVRQRSDVFALDSEAATAWRSLAFGVPLPVLLKRSVLAPEVFGGLIAEFHRLGLITLRWRGAGTISAIEPYTPPPSAARPLLSIDGARSASGDPPIVLSPLPARRFAAAGMSFVWSNIMVENAREDMLGALGNGQWGTFRATANRMLRKASAAVCSAYGMNPLPPEDEAPLVAARLAALPAELRAAIADVAGRLDVTDHEAAEAALAGLDALVPRLRAITDDVLFPASFTSAQAWRETLDIGYDWVRLGGYLDSTFPIDEARDLIASGGAQPVAARSGG